MVDMARANMPHAVPSALGHLHQVRSNYRSTKIKTPTRPKSPAPAPEPEPIQDPLLPDTLPAAPQIFVAIQKGRWATDHTGAL